MNQRIHPFELVFCDEEMIRHLAAIREEAEGREVDAGDFDRASGLIRFGEALNTLLPRDAGPDVIHQAGRLVFHSYHYWVAGQQTFDLDDDTLRALLAANFAGNVNGMNVPAGGYVRLPRHRVWSRISEESQPEAIDGFFFAGPHVLFVLGLMPGRPGFSIVPLKQPDAPEDVASVMHARARENGEDFSNVLPGGELQGYFAVTNNLEALKLAVRCLWHVSSRG